MSHAREACPAPVAEAVPRAFRGACRPSGLQRGPLPEASARRTASRPGVGLWFYVGLTVVAWASAFVAIRVAVDGYSTTGLVLGRFLVATLLLSVILLPRLRAGTRLVIARADYLRLVAMGVVGAVGYNVLLVQGQRTVSAFGASLLINTVPIWTALIAWPFLRERLRPLAWIGVLVGFAGASLVGAFDGGLSFELSGAIAIVLAAIAQAIYFVLLRSVVLRVGAERAALWSFWFATAALLPFAGELVTDLGLADGAQTAAMVYLGAVPGAVGVWAWARSMERAPASRLTVSLYLVPPLAALMGWLVLAEVPAWGALAGGLLSIGGVALATLPGARAR